MDALSVQDHTLLQKLQDMVDEGKTYENISEILQSSYPLIARGLSGRSVRRFCASHGIKKKKGADLDLVVAQSISEVSGRKMDMTLCGLNPNPTDTCTCPG